MTEVVIAEDDGIGNMELNEKDSVRSLWKFCNSITFARSEVVFLVGAFLGKSARHLQRLVFFSVRLQSHSDWATFLTIETTKTTTIRPSPVSGN